jgi:hypothetical protein
MLIKCPLKIQWENRIHFADFPSNRMLLCIGDPERQIEIISYNIHAIQLRSPGKSVLWNMQYCNLELTLSSKVDNAIPM